MPYIENAIVAIAKASPDIAALLGANASRFYPDAIPIEPTLPAAAYQRVTTVRRSRKLRVDRPASGVASQLVTTLVQMTLFARSPSERAALGDAFIRAFVGVVGTYGGMEITTIVPPDGERDTYTPTTRIYTRQIDFSITYADIG